MRFNNLIAKIDEINQQDPNREFVAGEDVSKEVLYSQRMLVRLRSVCPEAPEALKIASYAQHIKRWEIPRKSYPVGRTGYLQWRTTLSQHHAQLTDKLMAQAAYTETEIKRVCTLIKKENLKSDPLSQLLEDVACLVFLEHYLASMMEHQSEDKLFLIIKKTWQKMSESGQKIALELDYTETQRNLILNALAIPHSI